VAQPSARLRLKIHPDLALAALRGEVTGDKRRRRDREYRLWLIARAVDVHGSGQVAEAELEAAIARDELKGLSKPSVCKLLQAGDGLWWTRYQKDGAGWLSLHGLARVCAALEVPRLRYSPVTIDAPRTLQQFRASVCYSSFARPEPSNPISRATLEQLSGVTPRTQRNYARVLGDTLDRKENAVETGRRWDRGDPIPENHFPDYVNGQLCLLRRLPSSFRLNLAPSPRGVIRKVNSTLRNSAHTVRAEKRERLFYQDARAVARRLMRMAESEVCFLANGRQGRGGSALWSGFQLVGGQVLGG